MDKQETRKIIYHSEPAYASLGLDGQVSMAYNNVKYRNQMKVAFSGSSGSGKTTLVTFVAEALKLQHISGSAGDVKQEGDKMIVDEFFKYPGGGHVGVIRYSALNPEYGIMNQQLLQMRREEIILQNNDFVTDRSPIDNMTYFVNQVGYHPQVTDAFCEKFFENCVRAYEGLTHLIYVKAVQPKSQGVEVNGSRVANRFYQQSVDAQFQLWLDKIQKASVDGPEVLVIDFWDLEERKEKVLEFLGQ